MSDQPAQSSEVLAYASDDPFALETSEIILRDFERRVSGFIGNATMMRGRVTDRRIILSRNKQTQVVRFVDVKKFRRANRGLSFANVEYDDDGTELDEDEKEGVIIDAPPDDMPPGSERAIIRAALRDRSQVRTKLRLACKLPIMLNPIYTSRAPKARLLPDEQMLWTGKPKLTDRIGAVVARRVATRLPWAIAGIGCVVLSFVAPKAPGWIVGLAIIGGIVALAVLYNLIFSLPRYISSLRNTHYFLTNLRIIIEVDGRNWISDSALLDSSVNVITQQSDDPISPFPSVVAAQSHLRSIEDHEDVHKLILEVIVKLRSESK